MEAFYLLSICCANRYLLRDFVTYGDVVRIKLPYKDSDLSDNQYIWLENHQVGRNGKLDFLQYSKEFACRPAGAPGIYAYYQIGRDILSGTDSQVWDQINRDNLKILPADGYWDYSLQREPEAYTLNCVAYDTKNYSIKREQPNALNGYQDQEFKIFPQDEDNALHLSAEYPMWRKIVGDEVFDDLPSLGDNQDAFSTHSKISMGTNPSTCNRATCHSDNNTNTPTSIISTSNSQYDTKAIYLSGLSIEMTPMEGGDFRVDIRWDDYDIRNDARWTGTIVLNENSELVLKSGSTFTVTDNAKLVVGNGCRLLVEAGASTSVLDGGQLVVESGAVATIHDTLKMGSAANILVRPGGRLVVDGGVLTSSSDVDLWEGIFVEGDLSKKNISLHLNFKTFIMKKTLTIFFVFISIFTFAQSNSWNNSESETKSKSLSSKNEETYLPFFADLPKTYSITHAMTCYSPDYNPQLLGLCCDTYPHVLDSNNRVTLNSKEYFIFPGIVSAHYIREDLNMGVIYRYYPELDTEVVWCDMRLSIGDTFVMPHLGGYDFWYYSDDYLVVDTVFYDSYGRKNIHFSKNQILSYAYYDYGGRIQTCFIEGIGPTYGPAGFIPISEKLLGALLCVHQSNDSLIYMAHPDLGCFQYGVGVDEYEEETLVLYPNPASENLHLHFDGEQIRNGRCIISNVSGIVVKTVRCHENDWDINVSDLTPGLYFLRYEDAKGYTVKKFVKN